MRKYLEEFPAQIAVGLLSILVIVIPLLSQAVVTQGTPATAATPTKLVANSPDGSIKITITGDTFPAKNIICSWSLQNVTIPNFTLPLTTFTAFTFQFNQGTTASTVLISLTPGTGGLTTVSATVNAATAVTGTF